MCAVQPLICTVRVDLKIDGFAIGFALNILASALTCILWETGADIFNSPELKSLPRLQSGLLANVPFLMLRSTATDAGICCTSSRSAMWWILYRTLLACDWGLQARRPEHLSRPGSAREQNTWLQ